MLERSRMTSRHACNAGAGRISPVRLPRRNPEPRCALTRKIKTPCGVEASGRDGREVSQTDN